MLWRGSKFRTPSADDIEEDSLGVGGLSQAFSDHMSDADQKIGVLLCNIGTPQGTGYFSIRRYLSEFLSDSRVIEPPPPRWLWFLLLNGVILAKRPFSSGKEYRKIWDTMHDESPLVTVTRSQVLKISQYLQTFYRGRVIADFCMRYGQPSVEKVTESLVARGCDRILFFPLYPQYSSPTTATACDALFRCLMRLRNQPAIRIVPPYYDHTIYIEALVQSIETHISKFSSPPEAIVVSYHGLPKRYITAGDLYYRQCTKTTELLVERLRLKKTQILMAFQSRFGKEEWLQPYTCDVVRELASGGVSNISVIAPGFATDCVETLGEIYGEIQEAYLDAGGKAFSYILCLNDHERHITLLINIIEDELSGWAKDAEPTVRICQNKKDK